MSTAISEQPASPAAAGFEETVAVLAPTGLDAQMICSVLQKSGQRSETFSDIISLNKRIGEPLGAIVIAEEAISESSLAEFRKSLDGQPAWSDIPILLLTSSGVREDMTLEAYKLFGNHANIFLLERPLRVVSFVSAVRVGLRARQRQYEIRDLLASQEKYLKELRESNEELARKNRELEQFAYAASHDLQEPLKLVSCYAELLQEEGEKLPEETKDWISTIRDSAVRAQNLVSALLEFARIGRRSGPFEQVDMGEVVADTLLNMRLAIEESGTQVIVHPLPAVQADPVLLAQVFQNLLANAIKFRGEEPLRIHIGAEPRDEDWMFFVRDNGIGLDPRYKEKIFGLFQRVHDARKYPGTGIGLTICRKIIECHGGRMWVESEPGRGSSFFFTIAPDNLSDN